MLSLVSSNIRIQYIDVQLVKNSLDAIQPMKALFILLKCNG